jgi:hypothetical protein
MQIWSACVEGPHTQTAARASESMCVLYHPCCDLPWVAEEGQQPGQAAQHAMEGAPQVEGAGTSTAVAVQQAGCAPGLHAAWAATMAMALPTAAWYMPVLFAGP